ncbi:hypothetical protein [Gemmatimonas sp.]|uniref:hypothetical protein n=1 Tax=Gemmatimonas sp. TaxID=1962908 RepID=UPI003DA4669D
MSEAFNSYHRQAVTLSASEAEVVEAIGRGYRDAASDLLRTGGLLTRNHDGSIKQNHELSELEIKLSRWGATSSRQATDGDVKFPSKISLIARGGEVSASRLHCRIATPAYGQQMFGKLSPSPTVLKRAEKAKGS